MRRFHLTTPLLALATTCAYADVIEFGAAYRCDQSRSEFELAASVEHNDQVTIVTSRPGHASRLSYGTHLLRCKMNGSTVSATVHINPPANGECMGVGYAAISSLRVGSAPVPLASHAEPFNWKCGDGSMLVRMRFKQSGSQAVLERCTAADWTWNEGYVDFACSEQRLQ